MKSCAASWPRRITNIRRTSLASRRTCRNSWPWADLIITKPGGLTTSEALALGKPLFILNPIPGQEAANSDFLLEHGAAAKANRVEDLPYRVEQLLGSKKLSEMGKMAKSLARANAAQAICREVLARMKFSDPMK